MSRWVFSSSNLSLNTSRAFFIDISGAGIRPPQHKVEDYSPQVDCDRLRVEYAHTRKTRCDYPRTPDLLLRQLQHPLHRDIALQPVPDRLAEFVDLARLLACLLGPDRGLFQDCLVRVSYFYPVRARSLCG